MKDCARLTDKQERYAEHLARGMESRAAAKAAGYSDSYARVAATRMKKYPAVARAVEVIRAEGRTLAAYDLVAAMAQAQEGIDLARVHKNPMAFIKGCELRAKLSGLLIDKVEVVTVDLKGALVEARSRVFTVLDITPLPRAPASITANGEKQWEPLSE